MTVGGIGLESAFRPGERGSEYLSHRGLHPNCFAGVSNYCWCPRDLMVAMLSGHVPAVTDFLAPAKNQLPDIEVLLDKDNVRYVIKDVNSLLIIHKVIWQLIIIKEVKA